MKKTLKRLSTLALAAAMVLAMNTMVFAATTTNGVVETSDTTITLDKTILVFNANGSTVYNPGITYNYSIAPDTSVTTGTKITDKDGDTVVVQTGPTGGATLSDSTAVFSAANTTAATSTGTALTDTITASVDLSKFTKAGVYRYVITETQPTNLTEVGITRPSGYVATRYLDVYVKNGTSGLEVFGYVCFTGTGTIIDGKTPGNSSIDGKTTGFVEQYDSNTDPDTTTLTGNLADRYYTYDLTIEKEITGDMADLTNAFPFTFATSNAVTGQQFTVAYSGSTKGSIKTGVTNGVAAIGTDVTAELSDTSIASTTDGDKLTIKGLPANTKFNITETNDTVDTYKVTISGVQDTDNKTETEVAANGTHAVNSVAVAISNYTAYDGTDPTTTGKYSAITFTNKLDSVSPTGIVLRFAPYLLILGAGIILLVLSRRRRAA